MKPKQFIVWNIQSMDLKTEKVWYIKYILTIKIVRHYSDSSRGERCIVYLTELYCSRLPESAKDKDLFYCKPKTKFTAEDDCWYFDIPIGRNTLARKLNDMFIATGLDCEGIYNHSLLQLESVASIIMEFQRS